MSLIKDVNLSEIISLKIELEFKTPEKLVRFIQQNKGQNFQCKLTFSHSKTDTFEAAVEVCKLSKNFIVDMHVEMKEDQSITIPDIDEININFSYLSKKPDIDCPGAKVYLYCDDSSMDQIKAKTLTILLGSTSKLRNLPFFFLPLRDIDREFKFNFFIRLMRLVCCGVCEEENVWQFFLTQELCDPRLLGGIAEFN